MSAPLSPALPGHALRADGRPFGHFFGHLGFAGMSGEGVALCECGATSEPLPSNAARRHWHRAHKDQLRT